MSTQTATDRYTKVDSKELTSKVRDIYTRVAMDPNGSFHFKLGGKLALQLGYSTKEIDSVPRQSVESFAGVGYHFDYAAIQKGDTVLDLGSGSGMDVFVAANATGPTGKVIGVDMTLAQLQKACKLAAQIPYKNVWFVADQIERFNYIPHSIDVVISNGVINLSADKESVFKRIARNLRPGGRLALSDIISEEQLPDSIKCNASLWAACIGGAAQRELYIQMIERAGMRIEEMRYNDYDFVSRSAAGATRKYDVRSISLLAIKE